MEIDMSNEIKKPIPKSELHTCDDETLELLLALNRGRIKIGPDKYNIKKCAKSIDDICRILGYRMAIECLEKYGD